MAVKKCCVENCKSCSTRKEDNGVTFHKFPKDATSYNEWQCITHYKPTQKDLPVYVCSRHFCKGDFKKNEDSKYILKSDAVPSIFPWTINKLTMASNLSDTEEPLSSIISSSEMSLTSSCQGSELENLKAIKKFIAEQEKEIQEMELEQKKNHEKKLENRIKKSENDNKQCKEILKSDLTQNQTQEATENVEIKDHVNINFDVSIEYDETPESENNASLIQINDLHDNQSTNHEENLMSPSVMGMILSDCDTNMAQNDKGSNKDTSKQDSEESMENSQKMTSPGGKGTTGCISLSVGCKVEVKNFEGDWYAAEVAEVDYDEMEVLVRYEIYLKKPDEWVSVNSSRLRPYTGNTIKPTAPVTDLNESTQEESPTTPSKDEPLKNVPPKDKPPCKEKPLLKEIKEEPQDEVAIKVEEKPKLVFEVGERCLARWRDNRRFCATIHKDLGDGKFEIIFDDGFHWICSVIRLSKMKGDTLSIDTSFQATAGSPSPLATVTTTDAPISPAIPIFHTHLFDPTTDYLGSKSERRERKRKLNIKEIFNIGQKKFKKQKEETTPTPPPPKRPRILKKPTPKAQKVVVKKEKADLPVAVASIIGTITKELEVKLKPLDIKQEKHNDGEVISEQPNIEQDSIEISADEIKDQYGIEVDNIEPEGCIVNPNDDTLDDEETEEPKSEGDPVLKEEVTLENFEKQDNDKHEEVIDKIKEAIIKLEGGINEIEKLKSPKVERMETPVKDFETPGNVESPKLKLEVKPEDLKEALAEAVANIEIGEPYTDVKDFPAVIPCPESLAETVKHPKPKRDPSKIKKARKLRLLQEKKVKRQVEKVKNELEQMKRQFEEMRQHMMSQEYVQGHENAPLPESFLFPGEWCCRWVNGQPVGRVSEIEGVPQAGQDKPALPRRSVQVDDKRLPPGWTKHMVRRSVGHSAGKWDVVLVSNEEHGNKRFHMKTDMRNFLDTVKDGSLKEYEHALLDFGVHLKISRRMGWIINTPDGVAEGPETILPADTICNTSPLVKRKTLERRRAMKEKRTLKMRKEQKRKPIKLRLQKGHHTYNSQLVSGESSSELKSEVSDMFEQPLMPLEDGYVYVGSLKVQIIENLLRCPAEGCFKNFRTKTLLQMHIKHYHRELKAMMGVTPKVLDLAYARQRILPNKGDPETDKKVIKVKINRPHKREEHKHLPPETNTMDTSPTTPIKSEDFTPIPRSQDSPKLRQALIHKPVKRPRVLLPVRRLEPEQAIPDPMNEDFDDQILEPVMQIPVLDHPLDFETAISTHTVTKPAEKKKKGDKKKSFASISKIISEDEEWFAMNSDELDTRSSFPRSGSPDSKMDIKMPPMSSESYDDQKDADLYTYTETGERIKIVHMKREEIINCHCGVREEDGLMVQCELCLCWQHALCHNIQRESEVPEKYTCSICVNPRRGRRSRRFLHDQDRLYEGLLPGAKPCDSLRRSHELSGNLIRIEDALHALRVKFYVATKKDHPKLYLWAKEWEGDNHTTFTQEKLTSDYSDLNIMINGMDKENHPVVQDDGMDIRTPPSEDLESDRSSQRDNQLGSQALLSGLLSSPGGASLDLPISTSELERLAKSVQESAEWRVPAPQPEAAIENSACRERLLRHIQRCHSLIETRLDSIEAQVAELESQDPSFGEHYETADYFPRTKQTIQMLMRDLDTMEELGVIT